MRAWFRPHFVELPKDLLGKDAKDAKTKITTRPADDEKDDQIEEDDKISRSTWQLDSEECDTPASKWGVIARNEFEGRTGPAYMSPSGAVCITLCAPAVYRLQLRTRSCDIWFPQNLVTGMEASFGFMIRQMQNCPALAVSLDASALCHLGQEFNDVRLFKAGLGLHAKALELLRKELILPADRQNKAQVATILTLQITEGFNQMDFTGSSWIQHSKGLTALLDNIDDDVNADSNFPGYAELVGCSFYLFHFWSGITERKRIRSFGRSGATALISIAERVPEALEMADKASEKASQLSLQEGVLAINMLGAIEKELTEWTASWNPCMRSSPFYMVDSTQLFHYQPPKGTRTKNPFPLSMEFRTVFHAHDHIVCTASLLVIREAMIDICKTLLEGPHEVYPSFGKRISGLKAAVHSCADSLCMAIPYFLRPENGQYGHVLASHPLRVAKRWYVRLQQEHDEAVSVKLHWCGQVAKRIRQRGIRPL